MLFKVIADSPPELGQGFQYLLAPLSAEAGGQLQAGTVKPGRRLRCWLSEIDRSSADPDAEVRALRAVTCRHAPDVGRARPPCSAPSVCC